MEDVDNIYSEQEPGWSDSVGGAGCPAVLHSGSNSLFVGSSTNAEVSVRKLISDLRFVQLQPRDQRIVAICCHAVFQFSPIQNPLVALSNK